MSPLEIGLLILLVLIALFAIGMPIAFALGAVSIGTLLLIDGFRSLDILGETFFSGLNSFTLVSIPMFILMGAAVSNSPAGKDLYEALDRWLNRVPGGLVLSNLGACSIFSALSGSSPATCAAIGKMGIPEMRKRGYPDEISAGSIAAGGTLGILIPPSITMIVYGISTETSIGRLFLAGVIPGLMLTAIFMAWTLFSCWRSGLKLSDVTQHYSLKQKFEILPRVLPFLAIVAGILFVLYGGVATPSEAAGVGALFCLVLVVVVYRMFSARPFLDMFRDSTRESVMIMMIIAASELFAFTLSSTFVTQSIAGWISDLEVNRWVLMAIINVFLLVAGFFLPPVAVILMTAPILPPIITSAGFDPYWFAVVLTINMEIGLITPPVGLNLYVINSIAPDISLGTILRGSLPYVMCMILAIVLLCIFPSIATFLPNLVMGEEFEPVGLFYDLLSTLFERPNIAQVKGDGRSITALCEALIASSSEGASHSMGQQILSRFSELTHEAEVEFFRYLTEQLDIDTERLMELTAAYQADRSPENFAGLLEAAEPRRQELLRRINRVPGATGELVKMRARLLTLLKDNPSFGRTDLDFQHLFGSWFNRGFLVPRRIHWQSPANILEKIIRYEAVHAIDDWDDLRRRVEPADRRCYAFFHPAMPDDPLIFVEVALVKGVPGSVQDILAENRETLDPASADTAVFYSISNCQAGLRGVSFGNSLIKQVVEDLQAEVKSITTFVTLSPIPGFCRWLSQSLADQPDAGAVADAVRVATETGDLAGLKDQAQWLRRQAAHYLINQKDRNGVPLDPVARFHLNNGAMVHDIHAGADLSENGVRQSCGLMVNYLYDLRKIGQFHEGFAENHTVVASREVKTLADAAATINNGRK